MAKVSRAQLNQAINKYNQAVRKYNTAVKKQVSDYNRAVNQHNQQVKRNIANYNREVRKFNAEQERRRQRLNQAIRTFNSRPNSIRSTTTFTYRESVERLQRNYISLDQANQDYYTSYTEHDSKLFEEYPTRETQNSIQLYNALSGVDTGDYINPEELQRSKVTEKLDTVSRDLSSRWKGALYSLSPNNPDASRHFCTSVREIFTQIIDIKSPDNSVISFFPDCEMHNGRPNRRYKIKYILSARSIESKQLEEFVESDIEDLLSLFRTLNDGTHGSAGKFTIPQLSQLKKRVEDSIDFITDL